jgi:hypothetical protein
MSLKRKHDSADAEAGASVEAEIQKRHKPEPKAAAKPGRPPKSKRATDDMILSGRIKPLSTFFPPAPDSDVGGGSAMAIDSTDDKSVPDPAAAVADSPSQPPQAAARPSAPKSASAATAGAHPADGEQKTKKKPKFNARWLKGREQWLAFDTQKQTMKCTACTAQRKASVWASEGCSSINERAIRTHEASVEHKMACPTAPTPTTSPENIGKALAIQSEAETRALIMSFDVIYTNCYEEVLQLPLAWSL